MSDYRAAGELEGARPASNTNMAQGFFDKLKRIPAKKAGIRFFNDGELTERLLRDGSDRLCSGRGWDFRSQIPSAGGRRDAGQSRAGNGTGALAD